MSKYDFDDLYDMISELLEDAPDEAECSEEENDVYSAMTSLKSAIENL